MVIEGEIIDRLDNIRFIGASKDLKIKINGSKFYIMSKDITKIPEDIKLEVSNTIRVKYKEVPKRRFEHILDYLIYMLWNVPPKKYNRILEISIIDRIKE